MDLFIVQHLHVLDDGDEDVKFIGVYSSPEAAQLAIDRLSAKPGFCDASGGFSIDPYTLDEDNWREGYATLADREGDSDQGDSGEVAAGGYGQERPP